MFMPSCVEKFIILVLVVALGFCTFTFYNKAEDKSDDLKDCRSQLNDIQYDNRILEGQFDQLTFSYNELKEKCNKEITESNEAILEYQDDIAMLESRTLMIPTYVDVMAFLLTDLIDVPVDLYAEDNVCVDISNAFIDRAIEYGIVGRAALIKYEGYNGYNHMIVCFETSDAGIIYIEPQTREIIKPLIGDEYEGEIIKQVSPYIEVDTTSLLLN